MDNAIDRSVVQSTLDLHNLILLTVLATVAIPLIVHIIVALYRVLKCSGWARRLGIWSLQFSIFGVIFLLVPAFSAQVGTFLIFAAVVCQIVSGFVTGSESMVPDIVYVGFIAISLLTYFIVIPRLVNA